MGKDRDERRQRRKARQVAKDSRRLDRKRAASLPDLTALDDSEWQAVIPRDLVETVLGAHVTWRVLRVKSDLLAWDTGSYNTCVTTDIHRRYRGVTNNPLRQYYSSHSDRPDFADKVGYIHNQVALKGTLSDGTTCVMLHVATAFPDALYLNDIELANPRLTPIHTLFPDQRHEGLGHGVFGQVLANLEALARRHGFAEVILFAADSQRAEIFAHKGFVLDERDEALAAGARASGHQIPMAKRL
jgi:hypothetical protein